MATLSQFVGGSPVKSIQRGTVNIGAGVQQQTVNINAVDMSKSLINLTGYVSGTNGETARVVFNSSSSLYFQTSGLTGTRTISWEVIEFV